MSIEDLWTTTDGDWVFVNPDKRPPDDLLPESHQVWVWMNGPGAGHWEIRGTGAMLPDDF